MNTPITEKFLIIRFLNLVIMSNVFFMILVSCTPQVPEVSEKLSKTPQIFPDYTNVTIPYNIAPLTFCIKEEAEEFVTRLSCGDNSIVLGGENVIPDIDKWRSLLQLAKGGAVKVEIFARSKGKWDSYTPFIFAVSEDSIDPYISYRLIQPSYVAYEGLTINQRNLSNFDETVIYNNLLVGTERDGQCINCHSYKNYKTDNMQFHVRQHKGGTVLVTDGKPKKLDLTSDSTISGGVYPAFNPMHNVIAYSVNYTGQSFHTRNSNKVEVQDLSSDLILYNVDNNTISHIIKSDKDHETYPWWSPDGNTLYYCSARFVKQDTIRKGGSEEMGRYADFKYDILKRSYNAETGRFSQPDTVFAASRIGKSATLPRISPDGRSLLFALAEYGCFHIWHKDADLYLLDLQTNICKPLDKLNSPQAESYHSWSSNGRWIIFSTRRDDTNYTRLYISYFAPDGTATKAFALPQSSPNFYSQFSRSYNIPEFMIEPVDIKPHEFAEIIKGDSIKAKYLPSK